MGGVSEVYLKTVTGFVNMRSSVCEILKSHFIRPLEPSKMELLTTELFLCPPLLYEGFAFLLTRMLGNTVKGTLANVLCTGSLMERLGSQSSFSLKAECPTCQALLLVGPDHSVSQHL